MDPQNPPTHGLLIDLDSLYDTRQGILDIVDPALFREAVRQEYFQRLEDSFPLIDKPTFRKLWDVRDGEVLELSMPTRILDVVKDFIRTTVKQTFDTPFTVGTNVYINTYPFKMTKEEASVFLKPMYELGTERISVHVVNWRLEDIRPDWVRENISLMIMYEYHQWLEIHSKSDALRRCQLPDVAMLGPRLFIGRLPTQEEQAEFNSIRRDAFQLIETQASGIIGLQLLPILAFSADVPPAVLAEIYAERPSKTS